jgi:hypothetical protein
MPRINEHIFSLAGIQYRLTYYKNDKPRIFKDDQEFQGNKSELLRKYIIELGLSNLLSKPRTTQSLSNYVLKHFSIKKVSGVKKIILRKSIIEKNKDNSNMNNKDSADQKIEEHLNKLELEKIQDKKVKKLLIIGCSDSKQINNNSSFDSNKNYDFGESINQVRNKRLKYYEELLENSKNSEYFKKKRGNNSVETSYFKNCISKSSVRAFELYGSKKSLIYNPEMKKLIIEKIKDSNLDVLIISGLFGIVRYDDVIFDYHLKINKGKNVFGKNIKEAVTNYIETNQIDNDMVFYSLSKQYLQFLSKPEIEWKNLWFNHGGRGHVQANDLKDFLHKIQTQK